MYNVIVAGGGASGLTAAIFAAKNGYQVTILEHKDRVGKKILMTGNGRCNLTNMSDVHGKYYSSDKQSLQKIYDTLVSLGFEVVKPGGTFYIFPKALEADSVAFCKKALDYDLVLVPADSFGCPGYFRMAYCVETQKVERAMAALRKFVETEYSM